MRILISSYSFGAGRGSEAGVGWNVAVGMAARGHEVWVVTTSEFHHLNTAALADADFSLRLVEFDAGLTHFNSARSYRAWQNAVGAELRRLVQENQFDLIHHVTFNQYRALRDVFSVNLPYVIGPIGGAETVHPRFWKELPPAMALKEVVRYVPWDVIPLKQRMTASPVRGVVLASTPQTQDRLSRVAGIDDVRLTPIISLHDEEILDEKPQLGQERYFVFDGGGRPEKGLKLMLRALARLWRAGIECPVKVAAVSERERPWIQQYAGRVGLPDKAVELVPFMPRTDLITMVRGSAGFISVGFRDAGCMALLEAIAQGVPALCLDLPGQHWLPTEYAIKIPIKERGLEQRVADAMKQLYDQPRNPDEWHVARAQWMRENMSWRVRLDYLEKTYQELTSPGMI